MSFDPLKAVHIHAHGARTIDTDVIGVAEEENLLIHACAFAAARQKLRETTPEGELIFRADYDPTLTWNVRATVLAFAGLADAHPGPLSRQALLFANGYRYPHQFRREAEGEDVGILFYEDPSTDHDGGDTPEINFRVALEFSDLDTTNHAGEETLGAGWTVTVPGYTPEPPVPDEFVEIPVQTPALIIDAAREDLGEDIFLAAANFGTAPLTATLYDGDPLGAGTAISDPLTLAAWLDQTEPDVPETTVTRNHAVVDWPATAADRTCSHILWVRNGINVSSKALAAPLAIPAFKGVRAPISALALQLTWPQAGDMAGSWTEHPARLATRYLFGAETLGPAETTCYVTCFDGDPQTTGNAIGDPDLTLERSVAGWTVAGSTATSAAAVNGTDAAPPGGWTIPFAVVGIGDVQTWWIVKEFSPPLFVPEGSTISIAAGEFTVTSA